MVGRDLLIGATVGACLHVLGFLAYLVAEWLGAPVDPDSEVWLYTLLGGRHLAAGFVDAQGFAVLLGLFWFLVLVLLRFLLRSQWLAATVIVFLWTAIVALGSGSCVFAIQMAIALATIVFVLIRHGLLAMAATLFSFFMLRFFPITSDLNAYYWQSSLFCLAIVAAIGVYGFYTCLGGRVSRSRSLI